VQQAEASVQSIDAQLTVQQAQIDSNDAQRKSRAGGARVRAAASDRYQALANKGFGSLQNAQQFTASCVSKKPRCTLRNRSSPWRSGNFQSLKAQRLGAEANARADQGPAPSGTGQSLERTRIVSPVDGY